MAYIINPRTASISLLKKINRKAESLPCPRVAHSRPAPAATQASPAEGLRVQEALGRWRRSASDIELTFGDRVAHLDRHFLGPARDHAERANAAELRCDGCRDVGAAVRNVESAPCALLSFRVDAGGGRELGWLPFWAQCELGGGGGIRRGGDVKMDVDVEVRAGINKNGFECFLEPTKRLCRLGGQYKPSLLPE